MSGHQIDDDDRHDQQVNGNHVSDDDIRALLAQEKTNSERLKRQLESERTGRNRAEQTATTHQAARFDAEDLAVSARIEAAESQAAGLKKALSDAYAEGHFDEVADLQDKLAELRATQNQDRQYKKWLEGEKGRQQTQQQTQRQQTDEVDLSQYSPAQRKWIRQHPEFMDDPKVRQKTFAGHQLALAEGHEIDSEDYFRIIDEMVSRGTRQEREEEEPPRRRPPTLEVPVSRNAPRQTDRRREIKLTADEMEAADITNPDVPVQGHHDRDGNWVPGRYEKYALQRQKLKERGQG